MRDLARIWWDTKTRVTCCVKHVRRQPDGTNHPVHWLEDTLERFHSRFISEGGELGHYYWTQLLVQNVPEGTLNTHVRSAFQQWNPYRVNPMARGKFFYVVFASAQDCTDGLRGSELNAFSLKATVTRRPKMGYTAFVNERPNYVLDVREASCVCTRCRGVGIEFKQGLMGFTYWHDVCPRIAELIEDVREEADPFSPSIDSLLDVLLCSRNAATDFHLKSCCYGECKACGWQKKMGDLTIADEEKADVNEEKAYFVSFDAHENVRMDDDVIQHDGLAFEAVTIKKTRPVLIKQKVMPSVFVKMFIEHIGDYARHKYIAVHQTYMEHTLKERLKAPLTPSSSNTPGSRAPLTPSNSNTPGSSSSPPFPENEADEKAAVCREECICIDMDFAENYEIVHRISLQSEHWTHQQVTLFIVISHFWKDREWTSEAHIFVSADGSHDTYFVQRTMGALKDHFKARGIEPKHWYFNTDGAPSHFKSRFTMQSLFTFKTTSGASTVLWETCAPGHGKGPWDGIGAVVKRLLRQMERFEQLYANGARDVFQALVKSGNQRDVSSSVVISAFVYHYILTGDEPAIGLPNVWSAIKRPTKATRPKVDTIPGIRSHFCFRVCSNNTIAMRELSCRCAHCMSHQWAECNNQDAGLWKRLPLTKIAASAAVKTRGAKAQMSMQRQIMAKAVERGEIIAMESTDDEEGFSFWLGVADGPAFRYTGKKQTVDGVVLKKDGWYIKVTYYWRYPANSAKMFKLSSDTIIENAEGVIARKVAVDPVQIRRSGRGRGGLSVGPAAMLTLSTEIHAELSDLPSLDSL